MEDLILQLVLVIDGPQDHMWLRDVRFFSANMLLVMCSTQLYANHTNHGIRSDGTIAGLSFNSDADLFLNYLFYRAESQLRTALSGGSGQASSSSAFSNCLAVQLVRGLVIGASYSHELSLTKGATAALVEPSTVLLKKLTAALQGQRGGVPSTSTSTNNAAAAAPSGTVSDLLWGKGELSMKHSNFE